MRARHDVQVARQKAELSARAAQQLGQVIQQSSVNALDPETMSDQVQRVAKASGVETVSIDAQSFHQKGLDRKFGDIPEVAEQLEQAAETGGDIKIPLSVYAQRIAPQDTDGAVASIASFAGLPSLNEVQEQARATEQAIAIHATESVAASTPTFRRELADVGREIGAMIRQSGATKSEAKALQAIIQTHVANMANSLGVSPRAIWNSYGARIMGEPQVQRDAEGNLVSVDGQSVSTLVQDSFSAVPSEFGPVFSDVSNNVPAALAKLRAEKTGAVPNLYHHKAIGPIGLAYGVPGNPKRKYKNGYGLSHIEAKHPGVLEKLQSILDGLTEVKWIKSEDGTKNDRVVLSDPGHRVLVALRWMGKDDTGSWLITAYIDEKDRDARNKIAASEITKESDPLSPSSDPSVSLSLSQGDYFPLMRLIARWRNADRSTLLHESAHLFLDMRITALRDLMESGAPLNPQQQAFVEHMQAVFDWLQIPDVNAWYNLTFEEQRKYQEKFARSFEAYVMEGRAPVSSLKNAFRSFASWLKNIYRVIANIPEAELNDDVRELFDAMFYADESVREAMLRQGEQGFFISAQQGGLTEAEWNAYRQAHAEMVSDAKAEQSERYAHEERAVKGMRRRALKQLKGEAKGRLAGIRSQVAKQVQRSRVYKAWDTLRNGKSYEGHDFKVKLYVEDLKLLDYSNKEIEILYKARLATKRASLQPIPIAQIAEDMGYANANELVDDLLRFHDMNQAIDNIAVEQFVAEHPEFASEERIRDLADASIFNEARAKVVSMELAALERMGRREARDWQAVYEKIAFETVSRQTINECKPIEYVRLANRAARNARKAFAVGNIEAAITFKRQELYNNCMAKEAKRSLQELNKSRRKLPSYRKTEIKAMDTRFLVLIQRALANMNFFTEQQLSLNPEEKSFSRLLDELSDETGAVFDAPDAVIQAIDTHNPQALMTIGGLRDFMDLIEQLDAQGKRQKLITTLEGKAELAEVQSEVSEAIKEQASIKGRDPKVRVEEQGRFEKAKDFLRRIGFDHFRASTICAVLDGKWDGPLSRLLIHTSDAANNREETLRNQFTERLDKIFAPIRKSLASTHKKTSKVLGLQLSTHEVFVMLLNMGNDGNRQRLISTIKKRSGGRLDLMAGYDLNNPEQETLANAHFDEIMANLFAEYLDDSHYAAAQSIWAVFDDIQAETDKIAKRLNGRSPVWVQPRKVRVITANGQLDLRGGYYPIRYDRELNLDSEDVAALDAAKANKPIFSKSGVSDGHLKSRVKAYDHGLTLTARALFEGLDDQIHYIAWAQWVREANKVLNKNGAIAKAIGERYGSGWVNALHDWVQACRDGNAGQMTSTDALADLLRSNVSIAGIGFNVVTAALQFTGYTQTLTYLGGKWSARGMSDFLRLGGRAKAQEWVAAKSVMMRSRIRTQFRELVEVQSRISGNRGSAMDKIAHAAYLPITYVQSYVDLPTWLGAYEKALYEGQGEAQAVATADRAVLNTQGSGRLSDLSALERGSSWQKLFTVFYTFFNAVLQNAIYAGMVKEKLSAAKDMLILLALQPVLESFLRAGANEVFGLSDDGEDDDEKMMRFLKEAGLNTVEFNLGLFVGLRELSYLTSDFGYSGPAGLRKITDTGKGFLAIKRTLMGEDVDDSELRAIISALGVWAGIPVTPINRAISGAAALDRGDTDNPLVMLTGYSQR